MAQMQLLDGAEIETVMANKTVQGTMINGARYLEFYGANGEIRGNGYTGRWHVEGDQMCFRYRRERVPSCWEVGLMGDQVRWLKKDDVEGTGTVIPGNPYNF
ncbi:MAG: hypothetical protein ACFCBW_13980 [Candidatus Competibacterales bacterium]